MKNRSERSLLLSPLVQVLGVFQAVQTLDLLQGLGIGVVQLLSGFAGDLLGSGHNTRHGLVRVEPGSLALDLGHERPPLLNLDLATLPPLLQIPRRVADEDVMVLGFHLVYRQILILVAPERQGLEFGFFLGNVNIKLYALIGKTFYVLFFS